MKICTFFYVTRISLRVIYAVLKNNATIVSHNSIPLIFYEQFKNRIKCNKSQFFFQNFELHVLLCQLLRHINLDVIYEIEGSWCYVTMEI